MGSGCAGSATLWRGRRLTRKGQNGGERYRRPSVELLLDVSPVVWRQACTPAIVTQDRPIVCGSGRVGLTQSPPDLGRNPGAFKHRRLLRLLSPNPARLLPEAEVVPEPEPKNA